jgi:hypothetical protein
VVKLKLKEIQGAYDVIISTGSACNPAIHLRRLGLRKCSLPLDWVYSESLSDVSRLFKSNFVNYMELRNMSPVNGNAIYLDENGETLIANSYFIKDNLYNILSVHDFPVIPNQLWFSTYPTFKTKLDKRVERFLYFLKNSNTILFVRWNTNYSAALDFYNNVLISGLGRYKLLIINPVEGVPDIIEEEWNINNVCVVQVPNRIHDNAIWDYVYSGLSLK